MANKKKNLKKKEGAGKERVAKHPMDLLFMTSCEIKAKDIYDFLKDNQELKLELWEEMNILELELNNQDTVDLEPLDVHFKNPSDAAFVKNRNIKTIFAVSIYQEDIETVTSIFEKVIEEFSGFLCSDSEDFSPIYVGSPEKRIVINKD